MSRWRRTCGAALLRAAAATAANVHVGSLPEDGEGEDVPRGGIGALRWTHDTSTAWPGGAAGNGGVWTRNGAAIQSVPAGTTNALWDVVI